MLNTAPLNLCNFEVTTNVDSTSDVQKDAEGLLALAVELLFTYTSGGGEVRAYVQTSLDQGSTWFDIACVLFQTASKTVMLNFSALTPKTAQYNPTNGTLTDNTAVDGLLGDRFRVRIKSTGTTYGANTLLTGRAIPR